MIPANYVYRCKRCNTVTPVPSHLKMTSCECGAVQVDHGWYGSRVLWPSGKLEDWAELALPDAPEAPPAADLPPKATGHAPEGETGAQREICPPARDADGGAP